MAKKIYQAIGKDGIVYQRQTADRDYAFAVVIRGKAEKTPPFCGRADLADAKANEIRNSIAKGRAYWAKQGDQEMVAQYDAMQVDVLIAKRIK